MISYACHILYNFSMCHMYVHGHEYTLMYLCYVTSSDIELGMHVGTTQDKTLIHIISGT